MSSLSPYGKRGGVSPNRGKVARTYEITLPDGATLTKRTFASCPDGPLVATGYRSNDGRAHVCVWPSGTPAWEGEFGRLVAQPIG